MDLDMVLKLKSSLNYIIDLIGSTGLEYSFDVFYFEDSDSIFICGTTFDSSFF